MEPVAYAAVVPPTLRVSFERASLPLLTRLSTLPRWVPFLLVLALMVGAVFLPGWGWILTALVTVFLAWLLALSWPRLTGVERLMRLAVILLAAAIAVVQANPR
jgi:O-antigen ligase